jgi:hypothetical protein
MRKKLLRMVGEISVVCHKSSKIWEEKKNREYVSSKKIARLKRAEQSF